MNNNDGIVESWNLHEDGKKIFEEIQSDILEEGYALDIRNSIHAIHEVTNPVCNEFLDQLSADTQGKTHGDVQKNLTILP